MTLVSHLIERLLLVSPQRWVLVAVALASAVAASWLAAAEEGHQTGIVLVIVVAMAIGATILPDSHAALFAVAVILWQWLASADDVLTPLAIPMALCLFVFHTAIALMAVTPISAHVDRSTIVRWVVRSSYVAFATVAMWVIVVVMNERRAPGSVTLTSVGFVTLTILILALRSSTGARRESLDSP